MRWIPPGTGAQEIVLAEDQLEYAPLTVAAYTNSKYPGSKMLVARVRLNVTERKQVADGEDLFISELLWPDGEGKVRFTPLDLQVGMQHWKVDPPIEESTDGSRQT